MAINHQNNYATNLSIATNAGAVESTPDTMPTVDPPYYIAFDATNINSHYEVVLVTSDSSTTITHEATTYDHTTTEEMRMVLSADEMNPQITTASDGATVTFDLVHHVHTVTLGGNRVLAVSNATPGQSFIIRLVQDGGGSRTVTWFSTIKWADGITPTLTTTGGKTDVFGFLCTSAGNYDGFIIGQNL